jgi:sec-independent protein translocase protein TatA
VFNIGPTELIVILIVALIVFGPKRLPEIGRTLGRSLNEFRRASNDLRRELEVDLKDEPSAGANAPATPPATATPSRSGEQAATSPQASTDPATQPAEAAPSEPSGPGGPSSSNPQG